MSTNIAPSTATLSVVHNKQFAAAYGGFRSVICDRLTGQVLSHDGGVLPGDIEQPDGCVAGPRHCESSFQGRAESLPKSNQVIPAMATSHVLACSPQARAISASGAAHTRSGPLAKPRQSCSTCTASACTCLPALFFLLLLAALPLRITSSCGCSHYVGG